ncbi:hypothetical protein ED733_002880 [Metarhizium rileyi]|uniref:beta-ketoacyl-[acyl-carrier-protein] synthase I n=1 Tax=Metarhizium rileyi (strain RCEF 4871) TaxID=1649241 RepID=A0A5C6G798_METRR|nr:hypothetical protein ED733_002880 [Metarhizium rileyi]
MVPVINLPIQIETQEHILQHVQAERVVEVGPSNILTNMMKRTWDARYSTRDQSQGIKRQFLGPQGDMADIYYQSGLPSNDTGEPQSSEVQDKSSRAVLVSDSTIPTQQQPVASEEALKRGRITTEMDDVRIPTFEILRSIIGAKLKKAVLHLPLDTTISRLVEGRSALSNELVGDIMAEFPQASPDRPEEIALDELCQTLSDTHDGGLGKSTASLVSKMLSSKLPGSYSQSSIRQYLKENWGLGPMRQNAVLLVAVREQPIARLTSTQETEEFLSRVVARYFQQENLPLPSIASSEDTSTEAKTSIVDAKAVREASRDHASLIQKVIDVLHVHSSMRNRAAVQASKRSTKTSEAESAVAEELSLWQSEHGDDYAEGIRPKFDVRKQRIYDSHWNWCLQDVQKFYALCKKGPQPGQGRVLETMGKTIANRACSRVINQLSYLKAEAEADTTSLNEHLINSLALLRELCIIFKDRDPVYMDSSPDMAPFTVVDKLGNMVASEKPRSNLFGNAKYESTDPKVSVGKFHEGVGAFSQDLSITYVADRARTRREGFTFAGRNVLITGAGKNSIGLHVLGGLLSGGARITVTTSSYSVETTKMYQSLYHSYGSKGSVLRVVPFNQGSSRDVQDLVQWIQDDESWDLDFIIPFAALAENGRDVKSLDSRSEIAHRVMLTNVLRMIGAFASSKESKGTLNRPATVLLPLSPNHGMIGNDGLYSESKASLEPLLTKWYSESWADHISLLGVIIGWTRGTGLMDSNDIVSEAVEEMGVRTFTAPEMAASILTLMGGSINAECQTGPVVVDLGGGLNKVRGFKDKLTSVRRALRNESEVRKAVAVEKFREDAAISGVEANPSHLTTLTTLSIMGNIRLPLPTLPDYSQEIAPLVPSLEGMVDLSRVVVVTGFSELGPYGNSRTRWEMEATGKLSLEGCIELAWMMGLIRHHSGTGKDGLKRAGWVDAKTSEPVHDAEVCTRYMPAILEHTGLRKIEPSICDNNYDPDGKESLQEITLQSDLPPFETTPQIAHDMLRKHGDFASVVREDSCSCHVQLKAGAVVMVPRSSSFNRKVAGQIPTGWSPKHYGISDDIVEQVDPVTLFSLVCTVEALLCSGITDPYELYQHIHVSELAVCVGSSMGGLSSWRQMHRDRYIDRSVKSDVLQETFINTIGAWINMLLMSSSGPLKTPVGACATSLESLDTGYDLIVSQKAKVALVGGVEDFTEDLSFEFGSMNATCDTEAEAAAGRSPREMSRPTASSRSGFVEAQGCGIQVLTSAELALKMGLPIFGIIAHTSMSADKLGRSVPAPGIGILTNAREQPLQHSSTLGTDTVPWPLLDITYRRKMLDRRRRQIAEYAQDSIDDVEVEIEHLKQTRPDLADGQGLGKHRQEQVVAIEEEARRQEREAVFGLGNNLWKCDGKQRISPIRGSLATWGLGIDDISVASLHGTSTVMNDLNEPFVIQNQMRHLGRQEGNMLPCVCQKWLTGHSKGAAGAWMVNGSLQMMNSGIVPGNRNADNIDEKLRQHPHLWFPSETIQASDGNGIKACSVTSFGFGQKGSQAIIVHPKYLYATIPRADYHDYSAKRQVRYQQACRSHVEGMVRGDLVSSRLSSKPPYEPKDEISALLDPGARF